jgi:uncharacterized protein (TIGR02996 family)
VTADADFLRAIIAAPDDDAPRLVYADFLDERGEHERAAFIRRQVRGEEPNRSVWTEQIDYYTACGEVGHMPGLSRWWGEGVPPDWVIRDTSGIRFEALLYRRGFIEDIICTAADWLAHGDDLRASHPVREVRLTTWPVWTTAGGYYQFDGDPRKVRMGQDVLPAYYSSGIDLVAVTNRMLKHRWPSVREWHLPEPTELAIPDDYVEANPHYTSMLARPRRMTLQINGGPPLQVIDWRANTDGLNQVTTEDGQTHTLSREPGAVPWEITTSG